MLIGNHFHLLLETPQANLISGMKYLMGTFSQGWHLGKETFRDRLMKVMDKSSGKAASGRTRTGKDIREHGPSRQSS